jgi:hypothetical protein
VISWLIWPVCRVGACVYESTLGGSGADAAAKRRSRYDAGEIGADWPTLGTESPVVLQRDSIFRLLRSPSFPLIRQLSRSFGTSINVRTLRESPEFACWYYAGVIDMPDKSVISYGEIA